MPPGHVLLFSHREPTTYGYPPGATEPYRLRYWQAWPAPTFLPLFQQKSTVGASKNFRGYQLDPLKGFWLYRAWLA